MRVFLAVFPPPEVQAAAHAAGEALRRASEADGLAANAVSWVKLENLHYTLRFIGEVGEDGARRLAVAATAAARTAASFQAALGGLGAFPRARGARVLWIGLAAGSEALVAVATALEVEVRRAGFGRADHEFTPHLTLGRVRQPGRDWSGTLERAAAAPGAGAARFAVDRILVVQSTLSPKGSRYEVFAEARLSLKP